MGIDTAPKFDAAANVATLGGQSMVFHCHFYNCALQEAIEEGLGDDADEVQILAAQEAVRLQLQELSVRGGSSAKSSAALLETGRTIFKQLGFGTLDLDDVAEHGGTARVPHSHYAMGWIATRGERTTPACAFVSGFVGAVVSVAYGISPERIRVRETDCFACGGTSCSFKVDVR